METLSEPVPGVRGRGRPVAAPAAVNGSNGAGRLRAIGGRVLVLNATYEPINVCTVRRATVLLLKARAEIVEHGSEVLHSEHMALERPVVIRLITYVRIPRDVHRRKITRKAVLARDSWTCQYCGSQRAGLTVDHVIPRSRGGRSVWENIVAACGPCNRRKGNRLPREIEMHPTSSPRPPGPNVFIRIAAPRVPESWEPYLGLAA
jgi:5-methylcytosine-specific restriction endonuclease McrA